MAKKQEEQLTRSLADGHLLAEVEPPTGALTQLAEQLLTEAQVRFPIADRIVLRLHCDGHSFQQIADLVGAESRFHVRRQVDRMKAALRETFQQTWDALGE